MGDQAARSADAPSRHLRAVRGPGPALRKTVSLYFHDTERDERHRWTLEHLLPMVGRQRPEHIEDPDRTFVMGTPALSLANHDIGDLSQERGRTKK